MKKKKFQLALVTGASSGIGEALTRLLADQGINLLISGRNTAKLNQITQELQSKVKVESFSADLVSESGRQIVVDKIHRHAPDLMINNAGVGSYGEALSHPTQEQLDMLTLNGTAVLEFTLEAARTMVVKNKQGVILNVSSAAAFQIFPCFAVYAASKALVKHFSESLDEEMKPYGVRVLTACPGMVATHFVSRAGGEPSGRRKNIMSPERAAQQIWWQIQKGKAVHTFDWKYRLATFLTHYVVPKKLLSLILRKEIEKRVSYLG